jgi:hypothetical protein
MKLVGLLNMPAEIPLNGELKNGDFSENFDAIFHYV